MTAGGDQNGTANDGVPPRMFRCPECGRPHLRAGNCRACGHREPVVADRDSTEAQETDQPFGGSSFPLDGLTLGHFGLPEGRSLSPAPAAPGSFPINGSPDSVSRVMPLHRGEDSVSGRVLYLSPLSHEPMDFDPWRWLAIPVWGLVLLLVPIAGTLAAFLASGPLAAAAVAILLFLTLRFIFSNRLIDSWHLVAALNGRNMVESMPVQVVRLRQWDGREAQLRFKGIFANGAVMEGDRLDASGRLRNGVLHVSEAHCERTGARISPRQPNARGFALVGSACLAGMALGILAMGIPILARHGGGGGAGLPSIEFPVHSPYSSQP